MTRIQDNTNGRGLRYLDLVPYANPLHHGDSVHVLLQHPGSVGAYTRMREDTHAPTRMRVYSPMRVRSRRYT